jgi:type IV fimbrial biogenesis protein FimT
MVELLVVLAVIGILGALAAPSFKQMTAKWRIKNTAQAMLSSYQLAMAEAMRRGGTSNVGSNVVIRKNLSSDTRFTGGTCTGAEDDAYSGKWNCGWHVFWDANGNQVYDTGDELLQSVPATPETAVLVYGADGDPGGHHGDHEIVTRRGGPYDSVPFTATVYSQIYGYAADMSTVVCKSAVGSFKIVKGYGSTACF